MTGRAPLPSPSFPVPCEIESPSDALNAAEIAVSRIEFETGATSDGHVTYWWRCACGKRGIPLTQPERVRANAGVHVRWHAEEA